MEMFNIIAGAASILSLVIAIFTFSRVVRIQANLKIDNSVKSKQNVKADKIENSKINQAGRDIN